MNPEYRMQMRKKDAGYGTSMDQTPIERIINLFIPRVYGKRERGTGCPFSGKTPTIS